jgi:hypothetical protein
VRHGCVVFGRSMRAGDLLKIALLPWKEGKNSNRFPRIISCALERRSIQASFELSLFLRFTISNLYTVQHNIMQVCSQSIQIQISGVGNLQESQGNSKIPSPLSSYPRGALSITLPSFPVIQLGYPLAAVGCQGANDKPSRKISASFAQATPKSWAGRDASGDWTPLPLVR